MLKTKTASMQSIADAILKYSVNLPVFTVNTDDNIASSVIVRGSFDEKKDWEFGTFQKSQHFIFYFKPFKNYRWNDAYHQGDAVTVRLLATKLNNKYQEFPEYTGTPEEAIQRMMDWIANYH